MHRCQIGTARSIWVAIFLSMIAFFAFGAHAEAYSRRHHHFRSHHHKIAHRSHWRGHWRHFHKRAVPLPPNRWQALASPGTFSSFGAVSDVSSILADASRYIGRGNVTGFRGPWCKAFVNKVLRETGHFADRSMRAIDGLRLGPRVSEPSPGVIAVMPHHIGFVVRAIPGGIILLSGNHGHQVAVAPYLRSRVIAFVEPR